MKKNFLIKVQILLGVLFTCIIVSSCSNGKTSNDTVKTDSIAALQTVENFSKKQVYDELMLRVKKTNKELAADTIPPNEKLKSFSDEALYEYVIYGVDNRKNFYEINDSALLNDAEKVGVLLLKDSLKQNPDNTFSINPKGIYGKLLNLCSKERFSQEPVAGFCSGFAVSKNVFVTAGHCINNANIKQTVIVYGYAVNIEGFSNMNIKASDIFEPVSIIERKLDPESKEDYCLISVNKEFPSNKIAKIRKEGKINDAEQIHVIGYPCGLPVKITANAKVYNNNIDNYFVANLDTYGGNSGSPVFNSKTHIVEGILVRGNDDFEYIPVDNCRRSFICPENIGNCRGEDVSRVSQFWEKIK